MTTPITIHVLAGGDLFQHVLNAIAAFMKQDSFLGLLRITALMGIVMASVGFLKNRDPSIYARWFVSYVLAFNILLVPKTSVLIDDISSQTPKLVDNVPVVFALSANLITTIGFGLAQAYDALFLTLKAPNELSMPEDLQYTKTGFLFGSRLIQASSQFRIIDPVLKEEMNQYFRSCVVGDIRLNRKYSVGDLTSSTNIWDVISAKASPLRMTTVNGQLVTCLDASKKDASNSLYKKLEAELTRAYTFFGVNLFGKPEHTTYEKLFETHLTSAFNYYQGLTDASSNIFLQSMMINAMNDGMSHYKAFTDSTAGIVNQQFTKSQVQHRFSWQIAGIKAAWFLPLLHTCLTLLLFGLFPIVIALLNLPMGAKLFAYYLQFFLSLQLWPVMFAILNACMTFYGSTTSSEYGHFTMANLDKIDELHQDISGAAGYMMMLIPFLANGLLSNLSSAFSNLATSMTGHVQGSTMAVAGEAASGSFGLGQTSFYNTTANSFSANKHDSNWTHMHGMHTEQLGSGVLKTITGSGESVFDVSPGMSRGAISINGSSSIAGSLNQAFEESKNMASNESHQFQTALSNASHRMLQLSQLSGHDMRFGEGVSSSETSQFSSALSTMKNIASDVAHRTGVSTDEAFAAMTSGGIGAQAGFSSDHALTGKIAKYVTGFSAKVDGHLKADRSSTTSNRYHDGLDSSMSSKEATDFNNAFNVAQSFVKGHHFDDTHSEAAQLSNQLGADLRDAQTASHNYDVAMSRSQRISGAKSYVESHSAQVNTDFNQAFPGYVARRVGENARDELFSHPGDTQSLQQLQTLGDDFVQSKREQLIEQFGNHGKASELDTHYQQASSSIATHQNELGTSFRHNTDGLKHEAQGRDMGINKIEKDAFVKAQGHNVIATHEEINKGSHDMNKQLQDTKLTENQVQEQIKAGKYDAKSGALPFHMVDKGLELVHLKNKEK